MEIGLFLQGTLIGFLIAIPVGPINVLIIRRTLSEGRLSGVLCGLGAATADMVYGSIAAFGLTSVSSLLLHQQLWLRLIGGVFLCYLGTRAFLEEPSDEAVGATGSGLGWAYGSTLLLTLTNPITIISYAAIFAGFGAVAERYASAALLVLGVFCGSSMMGTLLATGVSLFRSKLGPRPMKWLNRGSGVIIVGFGLGALS